MRSAKEIVRQYHDTDCPSHGASHCCSCLTAAIHQAQLEAIEAAAKVADEYAAAAVSDAFVVRKRRNSECIAMSIRALLDSSEEG